VWDGNETWLVMGGGGLYAAFPLAYAIILTALYPLLIAMLLALILRGVAFEFRWRSGHKRRWDLALMTGSTVAAACQGIALGALVQGIAVAGRAYAGGWFDWLSPFSLLTGIAVVTGYALLGATWLVMKTGGALHERAYGLARRSGLALVVLIGAVSLATPFLHAGYMERWFAYPEVLYTLPVPLFVAGATASLVLGLRDRRRAQPFLSALALFVLSYIGLGISLFPHIVPPDVTIWEAAAPDASLGFLLVGTAVLIPLILGYTGYAYWVFRGQVDPDEGYH
jgi:cytochrome d ubiquinol oxidase subunit II